MAAVPSAVPSALIGDYVNIPVASPTTERWPGAVDPTQYTDEGPAYAIEGPVPGGLAASPYGTTEPLPGSGGGILDTTYLWGTDGPMVPWDSSAGEPFAPSGALNPELHADDGTGAVAAAQTVVPAFIGDQRRVTPTGQTYNREYAFENTNGMNVPEANGRIDWDQMQTFDPAPGDGGGYDPWQPGYSERPILLNVAYQATPVNDVPSEQGTFGPLPDRSPWQAYQAQTYLAPADPIVNQPAPPSASNSGGWLLG